MGVVAGCADPLASANCSGAGTIVVTILFGPVNYFGANPKLSCH
jgi:hypothetical protein